MKSLELHRGTLTIYDNKVVIEDRSDGFKWQYLSTIMWLIFGIFSVIKYYKGGESFYLWSGLLITGLYLIIGVNMLFMTNAKEILFTEIQSIQLKQRLGNRFMDVKLKK